MNIGIDQYLSSSLINIKLQIIFGLFAISKHKITAFIKKKNKQTLHRKGRKFASNMR